MNWLRELGPLPGGKMVGKAGDLVVQQFDFNCHVSTPRIPKEFLKLENILLLPMDRGGSIANYLQKQRTFRPICGNAKVRVSRNRDLTKIKAYAFLTSIKTGFN